jgi:hypothetical protein
MTTKKADLFTVFIMTNLCEPTKEPFAIYVGRLPDLDGRSIVAAINTDELEATRLSVDILTKTLDDLKQKVATLEAEQ